MRHIKNPLTLFSVFVLALCATALRAQTVDSLTFDNAASLAQWQISAPNNGTAWDWTSNGTAGGTPFWGNRQRIKSASLGGALLLTCNPSLTAAVTATSPSIAIVPTDTLYLSFHQYFRNFSNLTKIKLQISTDGGTTFSDLPPLLNKDISKNTETDNFDKAIVQLPQGTATAIKIRFSFDGNAYFWLLDDIKITKNYPSPTLPRVALGEFLYKKQYSYKVDSAGHPYKPNALVVHIPTGTTQTEIDEFLKQRNLKRIAITKKCNCELQLEEWEVVPFNADEIPGNGNGIGAGSTPKITGTFDYYVFNDLVGTGCTTKPNTQPLTEKDLAPFIEKPNAAKGKIVAILDSGLDFNHTTGWFASKIAPNAGLTRLNDVLGYNFIDDNNNISDNHGHGTHIAGIITQTLDRAGAPYQLLPVKTHDHRDISTLFEVTCGTYYAVSRGASVLNCSWGYYGNSDIEATPLSIAIRYANTKNAIIVAATGNDALQLNSQNNIHLPANYCINIPNVISVTSTEISKAATLSSATSTRQSVTASGLQVSAFANYSAKIANIGANGKAISSTLPCKGLTPMSGTSMATPVVAARLLLLYNTTLRPTPIMVKTRLLNNAQTSPLLTNKIVSGRYIP